ncbi:MAG: hypothetical protein ACI9P5_004280 [Saprospiraceae bacterium]|jgi:hypothetical protein|tara:strand:+ start:77 stop:769 length:693 start_codon:yes stop_codon:yes gene_type:complete
MVSRKLLITSVMLVLVYSFVYYLGEIEHKKNMDLKGLYFDMLEDEKDGIYGLKMTITEMSKKTKGLTELSVQILQEADLILSIIDKPEYKHTDYMIRLIDKFGIDQRLLERDFSNHFSKYLLFNSINGYLADHLTFIDQHCNPLSDVKLRLMNRRETYEIDQMHRLDLQFYESLVNNNSAEFFYEINGKKNRIEELPLILDYLPKEIKFTTTIIDVVTEEKRTHQSILIP